MYLICLRKSGADAADNWNFVQPGCELAFLHGSGDECSLAVHSSRNFLRAGECSGSLFLVCLVHTDKEAVDRLVM